MGYSEKMIGLFGSDFLFGSLVVQNFPKASQNDKMRYVQEKTRVEIGWVNIPAQFNQTKYQKSNNLEILIS